MFGIPPVVWLNAGLLAAAILVVWLAPWLIAITVTRWWERRDG